MNSITNTDKGNIFVYVNYDKKEQQVIFVVKDSGRGIK